MTTTLTDRYVDAAMRTVPEKQRPDLSAELRASIDDQIDARVDAGEPPRGAERAVLTDLGDPDKLAAGYTDRPLHLIGPRYYLDWWRLLKLLLWIVLPFAAFGVALGLTLAGKPFGEIVGTVWVVLITTTVHLFFWTTLVFALVERNVRPWRRSAPRRLDARPAAGAASSGRRVRRHDRQHRLPRDRRRRAHLGPDDRLRLRLERRSPSVPRPRTVAVVDRGAADPHGGGGGPRRDRVPRRPLDHSPRRRPRRSSISRSPSPR